MQVIDFHSHVLPAADHGCKDLKTSILQLQLMHKYNVQTVVATPHFYPHVHRVDRFVDNVNNAVCELSQAGIHLPINVAIGTEVLLCNGLDQMDGLERLCIRGTNTLLLELPVKPLKQDGLDTVERIMSKGLTIVLAHIDRYLRINPQDIDELLSMGALAQINASGLTSHGRRKRLAPYIENKKHICAIGSDLHGNDKRQYKPFCKSQKILGERFDEIMCRAEKLLSGAEMIDLK